MKYIDKYDLQFISENCPQNLVPAFIIKEPQYGPNLHRKVKTFYKYAERELKHKISLHTAKEKFVIPKIVNGKEIPNKYAKNEYVYVYYATLQEREAIYRKKHQLMYLYLKQRLPIGTVCCSFNDNNEPINAFSIPLGKVTSDKDVPQLTAILQDCLTDGVYIHAISNDDKHYDLALTTYGSTQNFDFSLKQINRAHIDIQKALLQQYSDDEIIICDKNGNDYRKETQRVDVELRPYIANDVRKLFHAPNSVPANAEPEL